MEPYWFVTDAAQSQVTLESSAGDVWKYVACVAIPALCGVIGVLAKHILNRNESDRVEAREREKALNVMLSNYAKKQRGEDS